MEIDRVKELIKEISATEEMSGYIECDEKSGYSDNNQYMRILASLKQNVDLQNTNKELVANLDDVERKGMEQFMEIEKLSQRIDEFNISFKNLLSGICELLKDFGVDVGNEIRVSDYIFHAFEDGVNYRYEPIEEVEPVELKIKVIEKKEKGTCPKCKGELGKYPAISRKDNKTEICSNCGMLEALEEFNNSIKKED